MPVIVRGEGAYVYDSNGRRYLDGLAGLFVVQVGHGRTELAEAAAKQAARPGVLPALVLRPPAGDRAGRAAGPVDAPGDLNRVFFTTGGGEAVETAWKLAKQYWKLVGQAGQAQGDQPRDRLPRHPAGSAVDHRHPRGADPVRAARPGRAQGAQHQPSTGRPEHLRDDAKAFGRWAADRIAEAIEFEGADSVAAVFLEPVQNSGGCFPPPPGYFERVREICDEYDVLLVSDEVDLRVRPDRGDLRLQRLRLHAGHHHLRQGHDLGLLPDRRDDRQRPAVRAVQEGPRRPSRTATPSAATRCRPRSRWPTSTSSSARAWSTTCTRTPRSSAPRWRSCSTSRSSATSAARATSTGSSWSRTRTTRETFDDDEAERLLRGFLSKALFEAGIYCRADDRGDPVVQLAPPLIIGQPEFDDIEQMLRGVLTEASNLL